MTDHSNDHGEHERSINAIQGLNTDKLIEPKELEFALKYVEAGSSNDCSDMFLKSLLEALYSLKDNPILSLLDLNRKELDDAFLKVKREANKLGVITQMKVK